LYIAFPPWQVPHIHQSTVYTHVVRHYPLMI
jgi:hypothetical protein